MSRPVLMLAYACSPPDGAEQPAILVFSQFDALSSFHPPSVPPGASPTFTATIRRLPDGDYRTASTTLVLSEDRSFSFPSMDGEQTPYWSMAAPAFPPESDSYSARLFLQLDAPWLPPDETPSFDFVLHENEWSNYVVKNGTYDHPELCLWFNWCIYAYMGFVTPQPD